MPSGAGDSQSAQIKPLRAAEYMERDISSVIEAHPPEQMSVPVLIEKDQRCLQALFLLPHWWNNPVNARELASPPWDDRILTEDVP